MAEDSNKKPETSELSEKEREELEKLFSDEESSEKEEVVFDAEEKGEEPEGDKPEAEGESEEKPEKPAEEPAKKAPVKKPVEKQPAKSGKPAQKEYLPDFPFEFKTVLSVLLSICAIVLIWCVIFHPVMRAETIEVNGNYEFSDEEILAALNIQPGDHLLIPKFFQCRALERSTPYIDDVDVHISFPSTITVEVTERHKLAYIKVPDGYAVIDDEGVILEFTTFADEDVHPVLCGLDLDSVVIGQRTNITESLKFQKMILVLGAVLDADRGSIRNDGYSFYDSVREVRIVSSGLIFLTVELPDGTMLQVKLAGVENIDDNMQWLLYAIRADAFEGLPAGSLDMTDEEKIYRAYNTYY